MAVEHCRSHIRINGIYPRPTYAPIVYARAVLPKATVLNAETFSWDVGHTFRLRLARPVLASH
jgi:hypothetical protein